MKLVCILLISFFFPQLTSAQNTYYVSQKGNDENPGTKSQPFMSIQAAADVAEAGDIINVHEGIYRERITPVRGGTSNASRIVYQAAENEKVIIKGSEIINHWEEFIPGVWKVTIPKSFFEDYNPYTDKIEGDWFQDYGRDHHTGEVYLNGKSLWESGTLEGVLNPRVQKNKYDSEGSTYTWFTESDGDNTYIYANFQGANPNEELVEINVRDAVFYPDTTGIDYLTVNGFHMSHAATQWAPPTAEQIGLIGTFWGKGWIIENNVISDSKSTCITLGKDRASGHNVWTNAPHIDGATHYNEMIDYVRARDWSKENIGSHIVRNNTIFNCEQAGIVGSFGAIFSTIENNNIYDIWTKRQFGGSEMAGIKFHAPIDMIIKGNRIVNTGRGIWLDWMTQGTRVTGNLLYNNTTDDFFAEVNHGPYLVDNNIFLSDLAIRDWSKGGAFVHNLISGSVEMEPHLRVTPYHLPHSTEVAGRDITVGGDNRYYNNILVGGEYESRRNDDTGLIRSIGLKAFTETELPNYVNRNVYLNNANIYDEENEFLQLDYDPEIIIEERGDEVYLSMTIDGEIIKFKSSLISSTDLGKTSLAKQGFVNPDGSSMTIDQDYFGENRNGDNPTVGPFENINEGSIELKVW